MDTRLLWVLLIIIASLFSYAISRNIIWMTQLLTIVAVGLLVTDFILFVRKLKR